MKDNWRKLEITRAWTASVTCKDGRQYTTTIHGPNATVAEESYKAEHTDVERVIIRSEQRF